jgi:hypothetical protein
MAIKLSGSLKASDLTIFEVLFRREFVVIVSQFFVSCNGHAKIKPYRKTGDEDFSLLEYLYSHLKWEGISTKKDIPGCRGSRAKQF